MWWLPVPVACQPRDTLESIAGRLSLSVRVWSHLSSGVFSANCVCMVFFTLYSFCLSLCFLNGICCKSEPPQIWKISLWGLSKKKQSKFFIEIRLSFSDSCSSHLLAAFRERNTEAFFPDVPNWFLHYSVLLFSLSTLSLSDLKG